MNTNQTRSPHRSKLLLWVFVLLSFGSLHAQEFNNDARFNHAKLLYQKQAYVAARQEFGLVTNEKYKEEVQFYIASCAVRSGQNDGEYLIKQFVDQRPYHHFAITAFIDLGNYYYEQGKYEEAIESYDKSKNEYSLELFFKKGYSYFSIKEYELAKESFSKLEGTFSSLEKDAAYFLGFIHFLEEDYKKSISYIELSFESKLYREYSVELYITILYKAEEYEKLIEFLTKEGADVRTQKVMNYLADSYYATGDYRSAEANYDKLLKKYSRARNEQNYFKSGFSSYKIENLDQATNHLKRSAVADDTVGAYASYYLGIIYYSQANYPFAVTSFTNTTKYETQLTEGAYYQLVVSLLAIPSYQKIIESTNQYLTLYADGKHVSKMRDILSIAYANTDNYDLAISHIESLNQLTPQMKETYQRVSYLKGMNLFNDKKFGLATEVFKKALVYNPEQEITQRTYYWMGEALSILNKEDDALFYYRSVINDGSQLYGKAIYSLGYAYFNLKDYRRSLESFSRFVKLYDESMSKRYLSDTYMRIGDCNFALKNYEKGIANYKKSLGSGSKKLGEIYFQIGLLNRYLDKDKEAKKYFNKLIKEVPKSTKIDHAYFQIAQMEYEDGNDKKSIESYRTFMYKYPSSQFIPFAMLNQAVAYDNIGESASSIGNYKEILERFPQHEVAKSALLGLQGKSNDGDFDDFENYLSMYKAANPNSEALENIEFETARSNYYNQKYTVAIQGFNDFLGDYKSSSLRTEANYLIADSYFRLDQMGKALIHFKKLEKNADFSKYAKVLYRIASIHATEGEFEESNKYYRKMESASTSSRNIIFMHAGLMENYYNLIEYDEAIKYGKMLLNNARVGVLVEANANLIIGKSEYFNDHLDEALIYLLPLVGNAPDERGAESYLYVSKVYYDQGNSNRALESLYVMTNNFSSYELWQSEAFLLMADIFIDTKEYFQAKATLNSLIEHATIPEIKDRAERKLLSIEKMVEENE
ncbi:MAG: tetratricopeptide repeat protein [Reichenbachiella sp.]